MATRAMMARAAAIALLAALLLTAVPTNVGPADACWCRSKRIDEVVENTEQVFTFRVRELVVIDEVNAVAYGDVEEVFKGSVQERVRVGLSFKKLCVDVRQLSEGFLLGAKGSKGKYKAGGVCEGAATADAVAPLFEPVVQPKDPTSPRFIRADPRLGVRVAAVDELLRPTHFGEGFGVVHEFAMCPGGEKVLELVVGGAKRTAATVEVRDLATLTIDAVYELDRSRLEATRFRDFECHDETGNDFSYLVFRGTGLAVPGTVVEVWRSGAVTNVPADGAVAATVELGQGIAHVLKPAPESQVETWDIDEQERVTQIDLPGMNPVDVAVAPDTGIVTVLGGSPDRKAQPKAGGFLGRVVDGELEVERLAEAARPLAMEFFDGMLYTVVHIRGEGRSYQTRELDGTIFGDVELPKSGDVEFALSGDILAVRSGYQEFRAFTKHLFTATQRVERAGPIAALPEVDSGFVVTVGDFPPVVDASGSIVKGGPLPPSQRPVAVAPSRLPWVLAALAAGAVALVTIVVLKRRGSTPDDDGWMA